VIIEMTTTNWASLTADSKTEILKRLNVRVRLIEYRTTTRGVKKVDCGFVEVR